MPTMITGSRGITNTTYIKAILDLYDITKFIHGGAKGVDTIAGTIMSDKCEVIVYPADWSLGKSAGYIRNKQMIDNSTRTIAIWDGISKGTKHAIKESINTLGIYNVKVHLTTKITVNMDEVGIPAKEVFKLLKVSYTDEDSKYDILRKLREVYNPLEPEELMKLNNKNIRPSNTREYYALCSFLVDKVLLVDGSYIPLLQPLSNYALLKGGDNLMSTVINNRLHKLNYKDIHDFLNPHVGTLKLITPKHQTMDIGVELLTKFFNSNSKEVFLATDSDADGTDSAALGDLYFKHKNIEINVKTNERRYGNGVNNFLVDEITKQYFKTGRNKEMFLIVTADHGSHDEERYEVLKSLGSNVYILVTDHHLLPKDVNGNYSSPKFTDAFINPQDPDSLLPPYISGCAVLYALFLNYEATLTDKAIPEVAETLNFLMPYVGLTTISDMMDLSKPLNRYFFKSSIEVIKQSDKGIWKLFRFLTNTDMYTADTMSREFVPFINACNRMGEAYRAYELLIEEDELDAHTKFKPVKKLNSKRRALQKSLIDTIDEDAGGEYSNVIFLNSSVLSPNQIKHASGVIGIVANNFDKPTIVFVKQGDGFKGSARANVNNVHLVKAFEYVSSIWKERGGLGELSVKGHRFAAGGGIKGDNSTESLELLQTLFDEAVYKQTNGILIRSNPIDVKVPLEALNEELLVNISNQSPFGNGFQPPVFMTDGLVTNFKQINHKMIKFKLISKVTGYRIDCISFDAKEFPIIKDNDTITITATMGKDSFSSRAILYIESITKPTEHPHVS